MWVRQDNFMRTVERRYFGNQVFNGWKGWECVLKEVNRRQRVNYSGVFWRSFRTFMFQQWQDIHIVFFSGAVYCHTICWSVLRRLRLLLPLSCFLIVSQQSRPPHCWGFEITDTPHSAGLLWTSDQLAAETSTWQHTTLTTDTRPCPRRDSNPQSQPASDCWPTS